MIASWPEEVQDEFLKSLADIERKHAGIYRLSESERIAVRQGLADLRAGSLASDDAVNAMFARYGT